MIREEPSQGGFTPDGGLVGSDRSASEYKLTVVAQPYGGSDLGEEPLVLPTVDEALNSFIERRHRITVFEKSRILFDPKQLPGVTIQESFEFLLKGLKVDENDELRQLLLDPDARQLKSIARNFTDFIDYLKQRNNDRTISELWRATDADDFEKMGLQLEIQTPRQLALPEDIRKAAGENAVVIRTLDSLLRDTKPGDEVFIYFAGPRTRNTLLALTTADGEGLDFEQLDSMSSARNIVFGGPSVSIRPDIRGLETPALQSPRLTIPDRVLGALHRKNPNPVMLDPISRALAGEPIEDDSFFRLRDPKYGFKPNPERNFPAIAIGDEIPLLVHKGDSLVRETYEKLKELKDNGSPGQHEQITPEQ